MCWVILRGKQIYTVIQAVHSLLYIVAKCHFFSVVTWKDIIKYLQKCEGCTHFCEILYIYIIYIYIYIHIHTHARTHIISFKNLISSEQCFCLDRELKHISLDDKSTTLSFSGLWQCFTHWFIFNSGARDTQVEFPVLLDAGVNEGLDRTLLLEEQESITCRRKSMRDETISGCTESDCSQDQSSSEHRKHITAADGRDWNESACGGIKTTSLKLTVTIHSFWWSEDLISWCTCKYTLNMHSALTWLL